MISHVRYNKTQDSTPTHFPHEEVPISFELPAGRISAIDNLELPVNYPTKVITGVTVKIIPFDIAPGVKGIIDLIVSEKNRLNATDEQFFDEVIKEIKPIMVRGLKYRNIVETLNRDALTELYNRGRFDKDLETLVVDAKKYKSQISCLLIDIDFFKKYNDSYGHQAGDKLLSSIAQQIAQNIRPTDRAYRYGGEEFVVLLPDTENTPAAIVARRISGIISALDLKVTVSIGVSTLPGDVSDAEELVKVADLRLYRAKSLGRNRVVNN